MIKNLIFDFGNVLYDLDESLTESKLKEVLDPHKTSDLFEQVLHPFERGEISEEAFFNRLQRRSRDVRDGSYYYEAWNAMLIGMPVHRFEWLNKLRKTYQIFLLSNINITHLRAVRKNIKLQSGIQNFESQFFDKVYYSFEMGLRKPEIQCFEHVLHDAQIINHETLFIDDKEENIKGALHAGLHAKIHRPELKIEEHLDNYLSAIQ